MRAADDCLGFPPQDDRPTRLHGPIGQWDVTKVTDMSRMFKGASSFAQKLTGVWFVSTADKEEIFVESPGQIGSKTNHNHDYVLIVF